MPTEMTSLAHTLQLRELLAVLMKHYQVTEGAWDLSFEFNVAVGAVGPDSEQLLPGAIVGIRRIGITPASEKSPTSVDVNEVDALLQSLSSRSSADL